MFWSNIFIGFVTLPNVSGVLLINFIFADVVPDLSCSFIAQVSRPYNEAGATKMLNIFSLVYFWIWDDFKILSIIPLSGEVVYMLTVISFSLWYEIEQPANWKCLFVL